MARPTSPGDLASRTVTVIRAVVGTAVKHLTRGDLSWMDDRMLRDIGLTRHDVWSVPPDPLLRDRIASTDGNRRRAGPASRERSARAALQRLWAADSRTT